MIFSIQRFLEDYFERRNFTDVDQFAVSLANLYDKRRGQTSADEFLIAMRRLRTLFYKNNFSLNRSDFERSLLKLLDTRFDPKKKAAETGLFLSNGLSQARKRLEFSSRLTIRQILLEYKSAVESRGIDAFWKSRGKGELRSKPESIAQAMLATSLKMFFRNRDSGLVLREFASGIGFVDVGILLSRVLHIVELKVLISSFQGPAQLKQYMLSEHRREGWLIVIDTRPDKLKTKLAEVIHTKKAGTIRILSVDINPTAPSKKTKSQT